MSEDFNIHERLYVRAEFWMNVVQHLTTASIISYAIISTIWRKYANSRA